MMDLPPLPVTTHNTVTYEVVEYAAQVTQTPVLALYLILQQEKGEIGKCNATRDCGPFQVNKQHFGELQQLGLTPAMVIHSALGNALAAGVVLKGKLRTCYPRGYDWFGAVACYHSKTPEYRLTYRSHLIRHAKQILPADAIQSLATPMRSPSKASTQ